MNYLNTNTKFIINVKLNEQYSNVNENKYKRGMGWVEK